MQQMPITPADWDSFTMVTPSRSTAKLDSAYGAGLVPPSGYYSSENGRRLLKHEPAMNPDVSGVYYAAGAAAILLYLYLYRY